MSRPICSSEEEEEQKDPGGGRLFQRAPGLQARHQRDLTGTAILTAMPMANERSSKNVVDVEAR